MAKKKKKDNLKKDIKELKKQRRYLLKEGKEKIRATTKKRSKRFKNLLIFSALVIILSLLLSTLKYNMILSLGKTTLYLDSTLWGSLYIIGIATFSISFIIYQMNESFKDSIKLEFLKREMDMYVNVCLQLEHLEKVKTSEDLKRSRKIIDEILRPFDDSEELSIDFVESLIKSYLKKPRISEEDKEAIRTFLKKIVPKLRESEKKKL